MVLMLLPKEFTCFLYLKQSSPSRQCKNVSGWEGGTVGWTELQRDPENKRGLKEKK